jgi:2,3-bisphosphoglycerate-independent phosphoglycerate mutase
LKSPHQQALNLNKKHRPLALVILDGWGYSESKNGNAIFAANPKNFNYLWQNCPHTLLSASGLDVGLPRGQMGNSEVGHLHIGSGRFVPQDLTRIDLAVESGEFFNNPVLVETVDKTIKANGALHIFGLLSPGGVHSRDLHLEAMAELAIKRGLKKVFVHAFLDGRDTPPKSAAQSIKSMQKKFETLGFGQIASLSGRYYPMDRDKRWERVEIAYKMLTEGHAQFSAKDALAGLEMAYNRGETDEFVKPTLILDQNNQPVFIKDHDSIVFMNFRADRGRELSYAFTDPDFTGFKRTALPKLTAYTTLTEYASNLKVKVAYPPIVLTNVLGEIVAKNNLTQLRIAETEKYAHVTYFLNGGHEEVFPHEDRILIPSPKVATYDLQPEMSAKEVTEKLVAAITAKKYDLIVCNYANPDMVGHTGKFEETVKAINFIDDCLGKVVSALKEVGGEMLVIADHGNAEQMIDESNGQPFTAHTCNLVPCIFVGRKAKITKNPGKLTDIAPTLLSLLQIKIPGEMTGENLVEIV